MPSIFDVFNPERRNRSLRALVAAVPARQLLPLWGGIFSTFATLGFVMDIMSRGRYPVAMLTVIVIGSGTFSIAYANAAIRLHRRRILALVAAQTVFAWMVSRGFQLVAVPDPRRLTLDAVGIIVTVGVSYLLFLRFINGTAARYLSAQAEIRLARDMHRVLVPPVSTTIGEFEFYGLSAPSGEVGGDLVDVDGGERDWLGYVADVSGHGVGAGLVMGMFKSAVRMRLLTASPLERVFDDLNAVLMPLKPSNMYVTLAGVRCHADGTLQCAVAGHLPILRVRDGLVTEVTTPQLAVGMFEGAEFSASAVDCRPGDVLALLTDGLTEVFDREQREWGFERAKQLLAESSREPLATMADRLVVAARRHGEQTDDQTVLLIRKKQWRQVTT